MKPWQQVQKELKSKPIVEGMIGGAAPLYVERYLFKTVERSVSGLNGIALVTMFGGSRVQEGDSGQWRSSVIPSQTLLVPSQLPDPLEVLGDR